VLYRRSGIPTNSKDPAAVFFKRLQAELETLRKAHPAHDVVGIGIGAPNANYYKARSSNRPT